MNTMFGKIDSIVIKDNQGNEIILHDIRDACLSNEIEKFDSKITFSCQVGNFKLVRPETLPKTDKPKQKIDLEIFNPIVRKFINLIYIK